MKKIFYIFVCLFSFIALSNANELTIDIDNLESKKINILFEKFEIVETDVNFSNAENIIKNILNQIKKDLDTTQLFIVKKTNESIYATANKKISSIDLNTMIINKYSKTTMDAVLGGYLETNAEGKIELRVKLWDILDQRELFSKIYIVNDSNWKRTADIIADRIYEYLTGELLGHFDSKVIFISETGKAKNRQRKVAIMDFDGSNLQYITNGTNMVLTPIFSKSKQNEIIYLEYRDKKPHIFKLDLATQKLKLIGDVAEMTYAPNFNPTGANEIVFSGTENGYSNIYKINFDEGFVKQLTHDKAISTVPSWSPDGEKIVFVSDKTGVRKLYVMDKNGNNVEQISRGRGVYDKPSWSPDGKLISFVKMERGEFSIGLMTSDGGSERSIMSAYLVEGVKWSPNGRYLIYSKQNGAFGKASIPGIYTIDILTGIEHKLPTPENQGAIDPDWIKK